MVWSAPRSEASPREASPREASPRDVSSPASGRGPFHVFVLHHTHWDREWWGTFQDIRYKLVQLIDGLLDVLDADPGFRGFLLDGQTIVLRDYLDVRPEQRARLAGHIRTGRIQCGPWYILPDEFLVSGEAHVRNLWLARRVGQEMGIPLLEVGYIPDTFGHISQMPQILRGWGIDNAFVWRGYGGVDAPQEFRWESPDGSAVLTHWFPDGYFWMPFLHVDNPARPYEDRMGRVVNSIAHWSPRARTGALLMPYGGDHRSFDPHLARKIAAANDELEGESVISWGTLNEYLDAVRAGNPELETVRGELRGGGMEYPHIFPGVLSARLYLKMRNAACQTMLERYAEPLNALAWTVTGRYDADMLWRAWEYLVQNHPHDSICGCSVEPVHREMLTRFDQAEQLGEILAVTAAESLAAAIDTSALETEDRAVVVQNTGAQARSGWTSVLVERADISGRTHVLTDDDGREIPFQTRDREGRVPLSDRYFHTEVGFVAPDVPAAGYRAFRLARRAVPPSRSDGVRTAQASAADKGDMGPTDLRVGAGVLENAFLRVQVERDGTLTVADRSTGSVYTGLNSFADGGDAGDTYTYSPPLGDTVLHSADTARAHVTVAEAGPVRATLRIDLGWELPQSLTPDRLSRSRDTVSQVISTFVTLTAGGREVEIETVWENRARDHRLRALFPLGAAVDYSEAEGQFDVVRRPARVTDPGEGWPETTHREHPQQGWVSVQAGGRGLTIANRGLPEFEVLDDGQGTVAVTLLRSVGYLSRDDLLTRVGGAGPAQPTPDAQCQGGGRAAYAVIPHGGDWLRSGAYRLAGAYAAPLFGSVTGAHGGHLPARGGLFTLHGEHTLQLSTMKKAEERDALILRFWNVADSATEATLVSPRMVRAVLTDLRELEVAELPVVENAVCLRAGPHQIVTVALTLGEEV